MVEVQNISSAYLYNSIIYIYSRKLYFLLNARERACAQTYYDVLRSHIGTAGAGCVNFLSAAGTPRFFVSGLGAKIKQMICSRGKWQEHQELFPAPTRTQSYDVDLYMPNVKGYFQANQYFLCAPLKREATEKSLVHNPGPQERAALVWNNF